MKDGIRVNAPYLRVDTKQFSDMVLVAFCDGRANTDSAPFILSFDLDCKLRPFGET